MNIPGNTGKAIIFTFPGISGLFVVFVGYYFPVLLLEQEMNMTTTILPDWDEIAASGVELGALHRAELFAVLSEFRQLEALAARSCHALIRHAGGPEAMADVDREIHAAATDARSAHRLAKAAVQRIERQLAGQA